MPNYGALEFVALLIVLFVVFWLMCHLITKSLPRAFKAIRTWWHDSEPDARSNHR